MRTAARAGDVEMMCQHGANDSYCPHCDGWPADSPNNTLRKAPPEPSGSVEAEAFASSTRSCIRAEASLSAPHEQETEKDHSAGLAAAPTIPEAAERVPASEYPNDAALAVRVSANAVQHRFMYGLEGDEEHEAPTLRGDTGLIDALISAVRNEAIETILARAEIETNVVKPGMWFAAGWLKMKLLAGNQPSTEVSSPTAASPAPTDTSHSIPPPTPTQE